MLRNIIGIIIFLSGVLYAIKTTLDIINFGYNAVVYLDLSYIIKGLALPIPLIISVFLVLVGLLITYSSKKKKNNRNA
ncbi:MAG: hypothetical protein ABDH23_02580 [Endomicrobiia bacterium]